MKDFHHAKHRLQNSQDSEKVKEHENHHSKHRLQGSLDSANVKELTKPYRNHDIEDSDNFFVTTTETPGI